MTTPVNLNQVIYQTPTVEKVQVNEQQIPEAAQRQASMEEMVKFRLRTETVQEAVHPEGSREVDEDGGRKKERRSKKRSADKDGKKEAERKAGSDEGGSGGIVNITV